MVSDQLLLKVAKGCYHYLTSSCSAAFLSHILQRSELRNERDTECHFGPLSMRFLSGSWLSSLASGSISTPHKSIGKTNAWLGFKSWRRTSLFVGFDLWVMTR